jgi:AraC family transcriptional regulator, regulatory protein of adaptative response / methylated-DNA-[protein]-cysteine methyltransferase
MTTLPMNEQGAADEKRWEQVLRREATADFLYAVRSTGIFCRPSCPSRRPAREQVRFFSGAPEAQAAGFRACLRCEPLSDAPREAELVRQLGAYLQQHADRTVALRELARVAGLAPGTVQRIFKRTTGLSPRAWANAHRAESFRERLRRGETVTEAVYNAGFSAPSRAQGAAPLGMEPRRYRAGGAGEQIRYLTAHAGPLGRVLVARTVSGVCAVLLGASDAELSALLAARFRRAELVRDPALATEIGAVLAEVREPSMAAALPLDLRGTAFQARVWQALQRIPRGETRSYGQLAEMVGAPRAVRAVAAACGANPAAMLVPCHRVLGADGKLTGYRWGIERKKALLALEAKG